MQLHVGASLLLCNCGRNALAMKLFFIGGFSAHKTLRIPVHCNGI